MASRSRNLHWRSDHSLIRTRTVVDVTTDSPSDFHEAFLHVLRNAWEVYQTVEDDDARVVVDVHVTDHPDPLNPDVDDYDIRGV